MGLHTQPKINISIPRRDGLHPHWVSTHQFGGFCEANPDLTESNGLLREISWRFFPKRESRFPSPGTSAWDLNPNLVWKDSPRLCSQLLLFSGLLAVRMLYTSRASSITALWGCRPVERNQNVSPYPKSKESPWGKPRVTAGRGKRLPHYKGALQTSLPK